MNNKGLNLKYYMKKADVQLEMDMFANPCYPFKEAASQG
jgi:hypothetical protein